MEISCVAFPKNEIKATAENGSDKMASDVTLIFKFPNQRQKRL